ncbi:MAG TPA: hypothetical protein VMM93_13620, partial [Vicinamibacterales bacterium]|nr:hypothetical protein [Vicinamibacterales bacterium]
ATYAPRLEKRESAIDWDRPAEAIHNQIRGLHPWPLAAATFLGRQTQLLRSRIGTANDATAKPGTVSAVLADAIAIAAAPGVIEVLALQVAGKPPTSVRAFLQGHRVALGEPFEPLSGGPG